MRNKTVTVISRTFLPALLSFALGCNVSRPGSDLFNTTPLPEEVQSPPVPTIQITNQFSESPDFSDVLEIDKIIKLQLTPSSILAFVSDIAIIENQILVLDRKQSQLFLFDSGGSFLKQVGRPGEGPGEYVKPEYIASSESQFLLLDTDKRKISYYSVSGDWVKSDDLSSSGIHPINDFIIINDRAYFPNPLYTLSNNVNLPVNLIYDLTERKVLWGFEKRFPLFYKQRPPFRIHYTAFARVGTRVWFGPPHTSEIFIYDLDGRFVKKILPGIPNGLALADFEGASRSNEFTKIWRSKYGNSNIFHIPPYVLATYSGSFQSAFERMSIFDENGACLAKNFRTNNTILFNRLLTTQGNHIIGVVDINFFNKAAIDTFLTDQQKAAFIEAGWDESSQAENEENPYLVFFKADL